MAETDVEIFWGCAVNFNAQFVSRFFYSKKLYLATKIRENIVRTIETIKTMHKHRA